MNNTDPIRREPSFILTANSPSGEIYDEKQCINRQAQPQKVGCHDLHCEQRFEAMLIMLLAMANTDQRAVDETPKP